MNSEKICMLIAIIAYLLFVLGIGVWYSRKSKNSGDFYLGGRKLGPLVTAMSAEASDMSSYLLMGVPGVAYLTGVADAFWTAVGLALGTYINWLVVARRIRRYTQKTGSITIPDYFSDRFHDQKRILMLIAAVIIIVFFVPYTGSGFAACGKLFGTLFGADYHVAMIISAVIIVAYTALGGFLAASVSDLIQSIIMTFALVVILCFGIANAGGINAVIDNARSLPGFFELTATHSAETGASSPYGFITIISTLAWGLGYFGMPHILLRFMAIKDEKKLKTSRRIASIWVVISLFAAMAIGIVGLAMTKAGVIPDLSASSGDSETVIIRIAQLLGSNGTLLALVAGIILSGILAATMSTADSQLLAASSSVSENIIKRYFGKNVSEKTAMLVARITVVLIAVVGVLIAWNPDSSIFKIVSFAWAGFGAAFGPVVILSLFWRRMNAAGALAGMLTGGVMVFVWKFLVRPNVAVLDIYELLPAFILALVAIVVVSLLTKAPSKEICDEFDEVKAMK